MTLSRLYISTRQFGHFGAPLFTYGAGGRQAEASFIFIFFGDGINSSVTRCPRGVEGVQENRLGWSKARGA